MLDDNELLFDELYEKTKDCGRVQFINLLMEKEREIKELKKRLDYLRSGEYLNQLRFERDMLQHVVDNSKVSKVDKEFIDMTHRNTKLLEEKQKYKEVIDKVVKLLGNYRHYSTPDEKQNSENEDLVDKAFNILKEVEIND